MSSRAKVIEETKKEIVSMLVCLGATKNGPGLPLKQFFNDYRSQIGTPIPYKELGYATLEDFFSQIPDTVSLSYNRDGPYVKAVENDAIAHIVALVDNQKTTVAATRLKKKARSGGYRGSSRGGHRGGYGGGYRGGYSSRGGGGYGGHSHYGNTPVYPRPVGGYRPSNSTQYTPYIPPKNRYNPQPSHGSRPISRGSGGSDYPQPDTGDRHLASAKQETIISLPQEARINSNKGDPEGFVPPPEKRKPVTGPQPSHPSVPASTRGMIRELLTSYPNGIFGENIDLAFSRRFGQTLNPHKLGFKNMYLMFVALSDIVDVEEMDNDFRIKQIGLKRIERPSRQHSSESNNSSTTNNNSTTKEENHEYSPEPVSPVKSPPQTQADYIHDEDVLKADIKKVLQDARAGIWAAEFPKSFKEIIGLDLPLKQLGYPSVIEMMGEMSDVVHIYRASPQDWKLYEKSLWEAQQTLPDKTQQKVTQSQREKTTPVKPRRLPELSNTLKEAVHQVVGSHAEGLPLYELPETFKEMVGKALPIKEIGYPSLEILVQQLTAAYVFELEYKGEGLVLLKVVQPLQSTSHLLKKPGLGVTKHSVPADAVGPGMNYSMMQLPEPSKKMHREAFVCHIDNPGQFWLQLVGDETTLELEYLMDDLEDVYHGPNSDRYRIPESMVASNQVAVAIYPADNNWHRVTILRRMEHDFVQVYFTDYGGTCSVHKDNLRLLKHRFLSHPAQALQARFHRLKPPGTVWEKAAMCRMLQLTSGKRLHALIAAVDSSQVMSVCLCDTNGEEDEHIQDRLVEEGFGVMETEDLETEDQEEQLQSPVTGDKEKPELLVESASQSVASDKVAYVSPMKRAGEEVESDEGLSECMPTSIRFVELTESCSMHVMNIDGQPYVLSSEISAFLWEKDLLRSMLRQKRIDIPRRVFPNDEYSDLFEECVAIGMTAVTDRDGQRKSHLTMYNLGDIPRILQEFGHTSGELRAAIEREIEAFNPNDPYWRGEEVCSDVTSESGSFIFEKSHLQTALKTLRYRRKYILDKLGAPSTDEEETKNNVEELRQIEDKLVHVQSLLKDAESREEKTEEEFIGHCISEQYNASKLSNPSSSKANPLPSSSLGSATATSTATTSNAFYQPPLAPNFGGVYQNKLPTFGGAPGMSAAKPMDMSSLMSVIMPMGANPAANLPQMGAPGMVPGMFPGMVPRFPGLAGNAPVGQSPDLQQIMANYNLMLNQQLLQNQVMGANPMMNMNVPAMGCPGGNFMNPAAMQMNLGQMSMSDMSMLLLGQGRGVPNPLQQGNSMPRPGGLQ